VFGEKVTTCSAGKIKVKSFVHHVLNLKKGNFLLFPSSSAAIRHGAQEAK
jgi:hypothetical protein